MHPIVSGLRRIVEAPAFDRFIIAVILFTGVLVGLETYPQIMEKHGDLIYALDAIVLTIFVVEIILKMGAHGKKPWLYFKDPWNVFDFTIVAVAFIPAAGQYALVARLARLLRVIRLIRFIPRLRILVTALLKSIPSMLYVSMLLGLMFYMYAVAGTFLFAKNDPVHFGTLQESLLTLFRVVTLEDWTDVLYTQIYGCDVFGYPFNQELCTSPETFPIIGPIYFISFVLMGTMIVLNLFIGVIISGMDEATEEANREDIKQRLKGPKSLRRELDELDETLKAVHDHLDNLREWARQIEEEKAARERQTGADGEVDG
jgi:voltage-gated sodium channel